MDVELHDVWKAFTSKALSFLLDGIKSGKLKVHYETRQVLKIHGDGGFETTETMEPNYAFALHASEADLSASDEFSSLRDLVKERPTISRHIRQPVMTIVGGGTKSLWDYAIVPLSGQIEKKGEPFRLDENLFEQSFDELMRFFSSEVFELIFAAPLYNFDSEVDEMRLSHGLRIRRTTEKEIEELLSSPMFLLYLSSRHFE